MTTAEKLAREFCKDWPTEVYGPNDLALFFEKGFQAAMDKIESGQVSDLRLFGLSLVEIKKIIDESKKSEVV